MPLTSKSTRVSFPSNPWATSAIISTFLDNLRTCFDTFFLNHEKLKNRDTAFLRIVLQCSTFDGRIFVFGPIVVNITIPINGERKPTSIIVTIYKILSFDCLPLNFQ